jgi:L,D-transpeptidase YbiS
MRIEINIARQQLTLLDSHQQVVKVYAVSTALNGTGQQKQSGCTPLGEHSIRAKIGTDAPVNAVFVGRRWTGEIYTAQLQQTYPQRDWILTRILWLSGKQQGFNRLGQVDTMQRYIYIHGCPDSEPMGEPRSHGCIRMRNQDVMDLFERVPVGTDVNIIAGEA